MEAQAIGFLIPHSFDRLRWLTGLFDDLDRDKSFWVFVSMYILIDVLAASASVALIPR